MKAEFIKLIESIGFISNKEVMIVYEYKGFKLYLYDDCYNFYTRDHYEYESGWIWSVLYSDLKPIEKYLKKEFRSIKLKELLR